MTGTNKPVRATLDGVMFSFASQQRQYPSDGEPGISYFRGDCPDEVWVDCLLFRDSAGVALGILNHYPMDMDHEAKGNFNIWVDPNRQRQGIATALLIEAMDRYDIDIHAQRYSVDGAAWMNAVMGLLV